MSSNRINLLENFDSWVELAKKDPEAFEVMRARLIEETIAAAPKEVQQKLHQLQWKLDGIRRKATHPLQAVAEYNKMTIDLLDKQRSLYHEIADICHNTVEKTHSQTNRDNQHSSTVHSLKPDVSDKEQD